LYNNLTVNIFKYIHDDMKIKMYTQ
jgi:hypothetical protein